MSRTPVIVVVLRVRHLVWFRTVLSCCMYPPLSSGTILIRHAVVSGNSVPIIRVIILPMCEQIAVLCLRLRFIIDRTTLFLIHPDTFGICRENVFMAPIFYDKFHFLDCCSFVDSGGLSAKCPYGIQVCNSVLSISSNQ